MHPEIYYRIWSWTGFNVDGCLEQILPRHTELPVELASIEKAEPPTTKHTNLPHETPLYMAVKTSMCKVTPGDIHSPVHSLNVIW